MTTRPRPLRLTLEQRLEHELQKEVARTLLLAVLPEVWWSSIDHANAGPIVGRSRKERGVKRGIPDMIFVWAQEIGWIELKTEHGETNKDQRELHELLLAGGHRVAVCRSTVDVLDTLAGWGVPMRRVRVAA